MCSTKLQQAIQSSSNAPNSKSQTVNFTNFEPANMSARSPARGSKSTRTYKKKRTETFNLYIFKVLKQVHPDIGMSKRAMNVMNGFVHDTFDRIANEAGNIVKYNKRSTMDARAVQCACKLVLPGELAKHAETEANKAVNKYTQ